MKTQRRVPRKHQGKTLAAVLVSAVLAAGCEVVNPGPVADEYMTLPASQQGFVNGAMERLTRTVGNTAYTTALAAREIFPGGQTGSYGHDISAQAGNFGNWSASGQYGTAQQARWVAEEAIRQFEARGDVSKDILTQAYLWAGYANRVLGDGWCFAIFDGGPLEPDGSKAYHKRAEAQFTKALASAVNDNQKFAALAGRAQARLWLEDFDGAIADARQVPNTFNWMLEMDFSKGGNTAQRNHIMWANANAPYRSWTVTFTYYHTYFTETGDPRTPWADFPATSDRLCVGSLSGYGRVPCTQQRKYLSEDDDMRIAGGAEMRLLEAEALLAKSDANWPQAMTLINTLRTSYKSTQGARPNLQPYTATNALEAWRFLKRERGIELWIEGRRYADLRRWHPQFGTGFTTAKWPRGFENGVEGDIDLPNFATRMTNPTNNIFTQYLRGRPALQGGETLPRELCYNLSTTEYDTNVHLIESDEEEP
jgi:hypothetical protein